MWLGIGVKIVNWWRSLAANGPFSNHATLTNGLVSYWKLDEQSGVRYDSVVASANDLTDNNTVTYVNAGPSGVVADFVAANIESLSHSGASFAGNIPFTVAFWSNCTKSGALTGWVGRDGANRDWSIIASNTGWQFYHLNAGFPSVTVAKTTPVGTFDFVVAWLTPDGGEMGMSVNGATPVTNTSAAATNNPSILSMGATGGSGANTGNIGRVGFWNAILTSGQRTSLFNSGVGKSYSALTTAEKVGLVSYWNLDEVSGNRADSHGSNTLTDNNTVTSVVNAGGAMRNIAAQFTSTNSESLSRASFASVGSKVSIVAWVKFASNTANQVIIAARGSGGAWYQDNQFHLRLEGATTISALVTNTALGLVQSQKTIADPTGVWHQVVFSYDDTTDRVVHWYFDDGADTASTALTGTYQTTAATLQLGTSNDIGVFLGGSIDEVGLWSRVLTAQERTDLWNSGAGLFY